LDKEEEIKAKNVKNGTVESEEGEKSK